MDVANISHAMQMHAQLLKTTVSSVDPKLTSRNFSYSRTVLHSSYHTNSIIRAYSKSDRPEDALLFFLFLRHLPLFDPAPPDHFTYPFLFRSCALLRALLEGLQLHALVLKLGLTADRYVQNSLIHFYAACRRLDHARNVFDRMPERDVVSWTCFINGVVDADRPVEALQLFDLMRSSGIEPSDATIISVLRACADAGALSFGGKLHQIVDDDESLGSKVNIVTALIDMYAKCGRIERAEALFDEMPVKDVFAWTAMISGLASHGRSERAMELFRQMKEMQLMPDDRTITAVLCACRSAGWVAEGYQIYNYMHKFGVKPRIQHYGCMVDLLARAGHLKEAEEFIRRMPVEPDAVLWRTLIWAAKLHGDVERAESLMGELRLHESNAAEAGDYVLMGNVYATAGEWEKKARLRELMARRRIGKLPGCSKIEVNGVIHEFEAGDSGHPDAEAIYQKWDEVEERLKHEGYVPKLYDVLIDLEDEEKASQLRHHSEKLAVAYGLIRTSGNKKIFVVKNLRSCQDCHNAMKLVSKIYDREIIIRDRIKFHHFSKGLCSCRDFW